jgi:hypothetical protein
VNLGPRHTTIDSKPDAAALQNGENARDTRLALAGRVAGYFASVERYTATGSAATKMRIGAGDRPRAIIPVRVAPVYDEAGSLAVSGNGNFVWDSTTQSIDVYEPSGLTANVVYTLDFLVLEAKP